MKLKDEEDLANVLGMGFAAYANRVQNGLISVYKPFLRGEETLVATIRINGGYIQIEEGPDVDGFKAEIKNLERQVTEQKKEITSLNILLEDTEKDRQETHAKLEIAKEKEPLWAKEMDDKIPEASFRDEVILPIEEKPKKKSRRRKKKK